MENKDFLKCIASISVFFIFFFIPLVIFKQIENNINDMQAKQGLENLKAWAKVYKIKKNSFEGMENDYEISRIVKTLNYMNRDCKLILNNNNFCAKAVLSGSKNWCVDNNEYSGNKINNCDYGKKIRCE